MVKSLKEKSDFTNFAFHLERECRKANKELEEWMIDNYGPRCQEYLKDCIVCQKWKIFDKLKIEI